MSGDLPLSLFVCESSEGFFAFVEFLQVVSRHGQRCDIDAALARWLLRPGVLDFFLPLHETFLRGTNGFVADVSVLALAELRRVFPGDVTVVSHGGNVHRRRWIRRTAGEDETEDEECAHRPVPFLVLISYS